MAAKNQTFDVWVVENNTVYRGVPFTVVTDWVQQGRLLDDDRLRPSGDGPWTRLAEMSSLAPYVPRAEPHRAEDRAEALEPVQMGFAWKSGRGEADEDVDMIPLIDVSLVLLVFFMMTTAVGGAAALIDTPKAEYQLLTAEPRSWWVGITQDEQGTPQYSFGEGDGPPKTEPGKSGPPDAQTTVAQLSAALQDSGPVSVRIRADRRVPIDLVREMTRLLEALRVQGKVTNIMGEVSEKGQ